MQQGATPTQVKVKEARCSLAVPDSHPLSALWKTLPWHLSPAEF